MSSGSRIGVFGGSFDPVHNGHLVAAGAALAALALDKVLFVPAGNQWQKFGQTPAEHRAAMVELAIAGHRGFELSRVDIDRQGSTYTVDTLRDLKAQNPDANLVFILGTDALAGIESWKDAALLPGLATFAVVTRPGSELVVPKLFEGKIQVLEIEALDISSTEVRNGLVAGHDMGPKVPGAVLRYIKDHNLYRKPE